MFLDACSNFAKSLDLEQWDVWQQMIQNSRRENSVTLTIIIPVLENQPTATKEKDW